MAKNILIIEDEEDLASLLKERLARNGYSVDIAFNGEEALKKLEKPLPDLILLDIVLPVMDGYTFLKEMKKKYSIPVIVLTARGGMKDLFSIEGIKDYIVKPFEPEDLLLKIKSAIG